MWEPWRLITLWASMACYRDSFSFFFFYNLVKINWHFGGTCHGTQLTSAEFNPENGGDIFHQNINWLSLDCAGYFPEDRILYVNILICMCSWPIFNMTFLDFSRFWNSLLKYVTAHFFPFLSGSLFIIILSSHSTLYDCFKLIQNN
jgi:hypothetical protein